MTDKLWDGHDLSEYDPRLKPHLVVVTLLVVLEHGHTELEARDGCSGAGDTAPCRCTSPRSGACHSHSVAPPPWRWRSRRPGPSWSPGGRPRRRHVLVSPKDLPEDEAADVQVDLEEHIPPGRSWCHPRTLTTMLILSFSILLTPGPLSDSDCFCQNSRDSATELILLCMVTSNCNLLLNIHPEINKVKSLPSFLYIVWIWPLSSRSC